MSISQKTGRALLALCFTLPAGAAFSQSNWAVPTTTIETDAASGRKVIKICEPNVPCVSTLPFMLSLIPPSGNWHLDSSWAIFDYQASLLNSNVSTSLNGVTPIVHLDFNNRYDQGENWPAYVGAIVRHLNKINPRPYVFLRISMHSDQNQPPAGFTQMQMSNTDGRTVPVYSNDPSLTRKSTNFWVTDQGWISYWQNEMSTMLKSFSDQYPNKLIGVNIGAKESGEWFVIPYTNPSGSLRSTWTDKHAPWLSPTMIKDFYVADAHPDTLAAFCNWPDYLANFNGCQAPTAKDRNNSKSADGVERGTIMDPVDPDSARAALYNRYMSRRNVDAITAITGAIKTASGNRMLTGAFYGYQNGFEPANAMSGHTELTELLKRSGIDYVAGPYSYRDSRNLPSAFIGQSATDSPALSNKLWIHEDDSRTLFALDEDNFKRVVNLWDSVRLLRRNILSASVRSSGIWFLDLFGTGWFGRQTDASGAPSAQAQADSVNLWANLQYTFKAASSINFKSANKIDPQIAVFVDDFSTNYFPSITPGGAFSWGFMQDMNYDVLLKVSQIGAPYRVYLLSDLKKMTSADLAAIKLAILPNAINVTTDIRNEIQNKLKVAGKTTVYMYGAGYLEGVTNPGSVTRMSNLSGISMAMGSKGITTPLLQTHVINGTSYNGGPEFPLDPWFYVNENGAALTVLGTYTYGRSNFVSSASKVFPANGGSYTSVVSATPRLHLKFLRTISERAGVHHFLDISCNGNECTGDSVDVAGDTLVVNAKNTGYKNILFPRALSIRETGIYPADVQQCGGCNQLSNIPFNSGDVKVYRWQ